MAPPQPSTPSVTPRAYGTDRVHKEGDRIQLFSLRAKGWAALRQKTPTTIEYPGTGIFWDDVLYEVIEAQPEAEGVLYSLVPWPEEHVLRSAESYDSGSEQRRTAAEAAGRSHRRRGRLLYLFSLGVGLLPARLQLEWEQEYGINAARMSLFSLIPLLLFGSFCLLWTLVLVVGAGSVDPPLPGPLLLVGLYFWCESLLRLFVTMNEAKPMGSAPVVAAMYLVTWVKRRTVRKP